MLAHVTSCCVTDINKKPRTSTWQNDGNHDLANMHINTAVAIVFELRARTDIQTNKQTHMHYHRIAHPFGRDGNYYISRTTYDHTKRISFIQVGLSHMSPGLGEQILHPVIGYTPLGQLLRNVSASSDE